MAKCNQLTPLSFKGLTRIQSVTHVIIIWVPVLHSWSTPSPKPSWIRTWWWGAEKDCCLREEACCAVCFTCSRSERQTLELISSEVEMSEWRYMTEGNSACRRYLSARSTLYSSSDSSITPSNTPSTATVPYTADLLSPSHEPSQHSLLYTVVTHSQRRLEAQRICPFQANRVPGSILRQSR